MLCATRSALAAGAAAMLAAACSSVPGLGPTPRAETATAATSTAGPSEITEQDLARRIATFSDDAFEGRAPGTPGGIAASQWIADEMAAMGLAPAGENGTYFQAVPLVQSAVNRDASHVDFRAGERTMEVEFGRDIVAWTKRQSAGEVSVEASDLVFVGYGVVAPEYGWNDYEGVDVRGRTVVMLVNDPGFESGDEDLFNGRSMTYYGRWTYKFEEAARQGAAAAIIVHETAPASYPWQVVQFSWSGAQYDLERPNDGADRVAVESWITRSLAQQLFAAAGVDWADARRAAREPGFRAIELPGVTFEAALTTEIDRLETRNVLGMIPGAERPDEYVLYTAHWDHLGMREESAEQDVVFNGAVDNATGVATILEIAERFAGEPPPERSVLFLAVGAEESGLLGSAYYAANPLYSPAQTVGGMNVDASLPIGRTRDIIVIGSGASELEDILAEEAARQNRVLASDPTPEAGYFYRSDHVEFAKVGIPMLYADGGEDHIELGIEHGRAISDAYRANAYHKPSDEFSEAWDMSGFVENAELLYNVGVRLATMDGWPNWYEGNEFRAIRDASRAGLD